MLGLFTEAPLRVENGRIVADMDAGQLTYLLRFGAGTVFQLIMLFVIILYSGSPLYATAESAYLTIAVGALLVLKASVFLQPKKGEGWLRVLGDESLDDVILPRHRTQICHHSQLFPTFCNYWAPIGPYFH